MGLLQKPSALSVDPDEPFERDCFGLKEFGEVLSEVLGQTAESFVVNLEAPWGQGKTTFLGMWRRQMQLKNVHSLYFNAWETDFSSDPLIALIGELSAGMESMEIDASSPAWHRLERLKKIGARVVMRALPAMVKAGTLGALDLSEVVEEAIGSASEKIAEAEIQRYQDAKRSISDFRHELQEYAKQLARESDVSSPLVIVIDELDRCRPNYAISVLETVKHLFTVPGVVFVVATDSRQLSNAIKHVYGLGVASEDYLRRFFDLSILMPEPSTSQFVEALFARHNMDDFFKSRNSLEFMYDRGQAISVLVAMFRTTDCSLRDQQKCMTLLSVSLRGLGEDTYMRPLLLCTLIVLKVKRPDLFKGYVDGSIGATELIAELMKGKAGRDFFTSERGHGSSVFAYLIASMLNGKQREDEIAELRSMVTNTGSDFGRQTLEVLEHHSMRSARGALKYVLPRIEFFSRPVAEGEW